MIVAITDSVPPKTLSGRHLMTAGGTQTGVKNRTQVVPHLTSSHSFLVPEPSWSYGFSLQHCMSISWRHGDKKCWRWKGIRVHLDYRESGVAKKKRTVLHWTSYLVLLSAIFFPHGL